MPAKPDTAMGDAPLPKVGEIWEHHKGTAYRIVCLACLEETEDMLVVYQSLDDGRTWARPTAEWRGFKRFQLSRNRRVS